MTDNLKSATPACPDEGRARIYGFAPKKRHFIWRPPEEVEAPITDAIPAPAVVEITSPGTECFADSEAERARTEALAIGEAEAAPIVLVESAPEIAVETVPDAPPVEHRRKRTSPRKKKRNRRKQGRKTVREAPQSPSPDRKSTR